MKKIFLAVFLALVVMIFIPGTGFADNIVPQNLVNYVKSHPNATPQEIQDFANSQDPAFSRQYKTPADLITAINNYGSNYAFGGGKISTYLKNTLKSQQLGKGFIIAALFISVFLGALHALTPGHGKTMVAAYLVGTKGRPIDAVILGTVVTLTHTSTVIALGLISLFASKYILPQDLFPWLNLFSGVMILAIGVWLIYKRLRHPLTEHVHGSGPGQHTHGFIGQAHSHDEAHTHDGHSHDHQNHDHADHNHDHDHKHPHEHGHDHPHQDHAHPHPHKHEDKSIASSIPQAIAISEIADSEPNLSTKQLLKKGKSWLSRKGSQVSLGSLVSLGVSGGIVPCPDALVVLLIAISLNRIAFGIIIVIAFSFGLAGVLIGLGLLIVLFRPFMDRFGGKNSQLMKYLPVGSAVVVSVLGLFLVYKALTLFTWFKI